MLEALSVSLGIVSTACKKANVGRTQHYKWIQDDKAYSDRVDEIREEMLDFLESKAMQLAQGYQHKATHVSSHQGQITQTEIIKVYPPDKSIIEFMLKTQGKNRGYVERKEVDLDPEELKPIKFIEHGGEGGNSDESVSSEPSE